MVARTSPRRLTGLVLVTLLLWSAGFSAEAVPNRESEGSGVLVRLFETLRAVLEPLLPEGWSESFTKEGPHMDPHGTPTPPPPSSPGGGGSPG